MAGFEIQEKLFVALGFRFIGPHCRVKVSILNLCFLVGILLVNTVLALFGVFLVESSLPEKSATALSALMSSLGAVKLTVLWANAPHFAELLDSLAGPATTTEGSTGATARFFNGCFYLAAVAVVVLWSFPSRSQLPFPYWFPFKADSSPNFAYAYTSIVVLVSAIGASNVTVDTTLLTLAARICHRLDRLARRFENMEPTDENIAGSGVKDCVREHLKILKLIGILQKIVSPIFFVQVIESTLISCMTVFAVTQMDDSPWKRLKFTPMITGGYVMFYMYCWLGEQISIHCESLHFAIYCNRWFTFPIRDRKSVFIISTFTRRPCVLRGAQLFTMSLNLFQTAIRESFSYYMVLHSLLSS